MPSTYALSFATCVSLDAAEVSSLLYRSKVAATCLTPGPLIRKKSAVPARFVLLESIRPWLRCQLISALMTWTRTSE